MKLKIVRLFIIAGLLCFGLTNGLMAQSKKTGQESCDGVLDVVPTKALSFTRKRRPGKETSTTPANLAPTPTDHTQKGSRKKSR
jgi:hypothetical protein